MNVKQARAAIEAILEAIPDRELPQFDRIEEGDNGKVTVWWGSTGRHLGTAMTSGEREPLIYRRQASWDAIEGEMAYRADLAHLARERETAEVTA